MFKTSITRSSEISDLINEMFNYDYSKLEPKSKSVHYDVLIEKDTAIITADLPGITKSDLDIIVEENNLKIRAKNDKRSYSFTVPGSSLWELESTVATIDAGVLTLTVSKRQKNIQKILVQ